MERRVPSLGLLAAFAAAVVVAVHLSGYWAVCASPTSDACFAAMDSDHSVFAMLGLSAVTLLASAAALAMPKHRLVATLVALVALVSPVVDYFVLLQVVSTADHPHGFGVASSVAVAVSAAAGLVAVVAREIAARNKMSPLAPIAAQP